MAEQSNNFDQFIKDSYEGYEAPFNPEHWEELENELDVVAPGFSSYLTYITTGIAAAGIVFISMLYFAAGNGTGHSNISETDQETTALSENTAQPIKNTAEYDDTSTNNNDVPDKKSAEPAVADDSPEKDANNITEEKPASPPAKSASDKPTDKTPDNTGKVTALSSEDEKAKVRTGCTGLIIKFAASKEYGSDAKYLWNFGDGFFSNQANPAHTFNKEGIFDVSLSVTSPSTGQITSNVVQAMIEVVEAPVANVSMEMKNASTILLKNDSYNATGASWKVNGQDWDSHPEIELSLADNTNFNIELSANNEGGCSDTIQREIQVVNSGAQFPTAFEAEKGNTFAPAALVDNESVNSVNIFNSNGNEVFAGSGSGWDGTTAQGAGAPKGDYQWRMIVENNKGIKVYTGTVRLR